MPLHATAYFIDDPTRTDALRACVCVLVLLLAALTGRLRARNTRKYVRLRVVPYRGDDPGAETIVAMYEALHKRLLSRWWRRLLWGQPSVSLEIHRDRVAWFALTCPAHLEPLVEAALRTAYPNVHTQRGVPEPARPPCVLRLKKHATFIKRAKHLDRLDHDPVSPVNRLLNTMGGCDTPAFVQIALTPVPAFFEAHAKRAYKRHENRLSRERKLRLPPLDRSYVEDAELIGGLSVQHRPLFFCDLRIVAANRRACEQIASELRASCAENRLVERNTAVRHGCLGLYTRRVARGEGNPLPSFRKGVFASTELASLWHLPSLDYAAVSLERRTLPLAPAPPAILRPGNGHGTLLDRYGPVTIDPRLRSLNTAVSGAVGQGKSSYLVATIAEDLHREGCAVIVLDPKGTLAEAAMSVVSPHRTCTLLDLAHPTCGFHPHAVEYVARDMGRLSGAPLVTGSLLKGPLRVSFEDVIARGEILIVKGALGALGPSRTALLMQLLLGMLDAALTRRQQLDGGEQPRPVALKVDEAPLVLTRDFLDTMGLKRSAGLETVACWQSDAQWRDRDLRAQLDGLFAHRVYFATSSIEDARSAAKLTMSEFSDIVRPDTRNLSSLGRPDTRLHLPRYNAVASWVTPAGRQAPFVGETFALRVNAERVAHHAARQHERGARQDDPNRRD